MKSLVLAAGLLGASLTAQANVLDFGNGPTAPTFCTSSANGSGPLVGCTSGSYISQSYGDVAGVVDVRYDAPRAASPTSLRWWEASYNNLYGVAWADGGDTNSRANIDLVPLNGQVVMLSSFQLGAYPQTTRATTLVVTDLLSGATLFSYVGPVGNAAVSATAFSPGVSSANGLRIDWRDSAYNVGIDNISFSVTAVPEPATMALLLGGLAVVGAAARRRRG